VTARVNREALEIISGGVAPAAPSGSWVSLLDLNLMRLHGSNGFFRWEKTPVINGASSRRNRSRSALGFRRI